MRGSVLFLALAIALCLALPSCNARPGELVVKQKCAKAASAASSSQEEESETLVKKVGGCGCGCGASAISSCKKKAKKAAAVASSSASSSLEARKVVGLKAPCGCQAKKAVVKAPCGCQAKKAVVVKAPCGCKAKKAVVKAPCGCKLLSETQIKQKYAKLKDESLDTYFKRIVSRSYEWTSTTDAYVKTLSLVWKDFCGLDLWYNKKYVSLVKDFYSLYYAKQASESWESYYSRLVKREAWETEDLFAKRITVIRDCFPDLDLWVNPVWFDKYTKTLYSCEFKRFAQESDVDYINRIIQEDSLFDFSKEKWAKRIFLIQEATLSSCPLWYDEKYLSYFKNFYSIWYKKKDSETCEGWLQRALTPLPGESFDNAFKRITFIKQITGDCGCWKIDYFKKVQEAKCFQDDWILKIKKGFFPCGCGGGVTVERSSSKKAKAASSSSASESSEAVRIVKA